MAKNNQSAMEPNKKAYRGKGALDAFLNLLSLISLGWLAQAFGAVCFQLIGKYLGDIGDAYATQNFSEPFLKYGIAALIVITPVYFGAVNVLHVQYKKGGLNHNSGVYRWLTYLMLLVSSLTIVGSLVTLITSFLNGNYTLPFLSKVATVIIIAGFIFGYYLYDLRRKDYSKKDLVSIIVGSIVGVLIAAALVGGFMSVDSPAQARIKLEDSKTEQAMGQITYSIANLYGGNQKLAETYDLQDLISGSNLPTKNITYRRVSVTEFELCADFNAKAANLYYADKTYPWFNHEAGHQCYTINAKIEAEKYFKINQTAPAETPAATAPAVK
jgi:hypothetical protein